MNARIRRLGIFLSACYVALFAMLNYIQVFQQDRINEDPENTDVVRLNYARNRGTITTADGTVIARSVPTEDEFRFQREYPEGDLYAAITGYYSFAFGSTGLERTYEEELIGDTAQQQLRGLADLFVDEDQVGNLRTTIRADLQAKAREQLSQRRGAVVVLNPQTGAVLALWDYPSFDPNPLASHDFDEAAAAREFLQPQSPESALIASSYQDRFFPGSTFKVVVASSGLKFGVVTRDEPVYPTESSYTPPDTTRPLTNSHTCGGALFEILAESCNSSFARMAVENLGEDRTREGAESFGFDDEPPIDLPDPVASHFPTPAELEGSDAFLAQSAIGQFSVQASPLQMAMVAAGIANDGVVMEPYVVDELRDGDGDVVSTHDDDVWRQPISAEDAATMRDAMRGVVNDGTATTLQGIGSLDVGAKTGTAQLGTDPPGNHAWMIAWAGQAGEEPEIAVAVLVEGLPGAGTEASGNSEAGPIARCMIAVGMGVAGVC